MWADLSEFWLKGDGRELPQLLGAASDFQPPAPNREVLPKQSRLVLHIFLIQAVR